MKVTVTTLALCLVAIAAGATPAGADTRSFPNTTALTVPASGTTGPASLYPSSVTVAGMTGPITDVNVTVHRVGHTFPFDLNLLLVSPSGHSVRIMGANCGSTDIEDFTWIFDRQAANAMPVGADCPDFVYRPNPPATGVFPAPAPAGSHGTDLDALRNEQANGSWRLYAADLGANDSGDIEGGWTLTLTTGPVDAEIPGTGTSGTAAPYPAARSIALGERVILDVNVLLDGIWHQRPDDLDMLLVGPRGQRVPLMSDACGSFSVRAFGWRWDDEAADPMPDGDGTNVCAVPNTYRPTDHEPGDSWPAPAGGPTDTTLSAFDLTDPNGEWRLFVNDDSGGETGFFTNRFELGFTTRPKAAVGFAPAALSLPEGTTGTVTLRRTLPAALGAATVAVASAPAGATAGSDFEPVSTTVAFAAGETEKTVPVRALADTTPEGAEAFVLTLGATSGDAIAGTPASATITIPAQAPPPGRGEGGAGRPAPPAARRPLCLGRQATIVGTPGRDRLRGTARRDVIVALGGNDRIRAGRGDDLVCAGAGNDRVTGDAGRDRLLGGPGRDQLSGGPGADRLAGGTGRDTCNGGPGRDRAACERRRGI